MTSLYITRFVYFVGENESAVIHCDEGGSLSVKTSPNLQFHDALHQALIT